MVLFNDVKIYKDSIPKYIIVKSQKVHSVPPIFEKKDQDEFKDKIRKLLTFLQKIHNIYGLTHGDFTSSNILWNSRKEPFVIDFERSTCVAPIKGENRDKSGCVNIDRFNYLKMIDYADLIGVINRSDIYTADNTDDLKKKIVHISECANKIKELDTNIEMYDLTKEEERILKKSFEEIKNFFKEVVGIQI